ncbi:conserved repeat domain protein [Desulfatibacillum aliphaticivorans]|uniref:Conserved repeat domain protein n=1 Tax=Desulfatibacillum aliphaticivorans TaxID=218208 RepID=B8F9Z2_DESAL|nr:DUF11 domain-containing protein [Desulfatibacillum aliphaticivorans]ACL03088.1 conserved repeat domain protein [Desulfatibacillum aliphaticivorans]
MHRTRKTLLGLLALAAIFLLMAPAVMAEGTEAGEQVENMATITYSVGSVVQTPIESSPLGNSTPGAGAGADTTFLVDNKIVVTVDSDVSGSQTISPLGEYTYSFTIENVGNAPQGYNLEVTDLAAGYTSNIWVEDDDIAGLDTTNDLDRDYISSLAADDDITVYVVITVPDTVGANSVSNGDTTTFNLVATTCTNNITAFQNETENAGTIGVGTVVEEDETVVWVSNTVQDVFGDAAGTDDIANDGMHSDSVTCVVATTSLLVTKTSLVVEDPILGNYVAGSNYPKAIPGAYVEYTITIVNQGTVDATNVSISDDLDQNDQMTDGDIVFATDRYNTSADDVEVTYDATGTPSYSYFDTTDSPNVDNATFTSYVLNVSNLTVAANTTVTVQYQVQINAN